jgi:hypothetical protein
MTSPAPKKYPKLPAKIKIGSQVWEVVEQKRKHSSEFLDGTYGYTIDKDNTIVIDAEMAPSIKRVTLFHELLHAIRFIFGGSFKPGKTTTFDEWEHYFIGLYEEPVLMVLKDNPELLAYLMSDE